MAAIAEEGVPCCLKKCAQPVTMVKPRVEVKSFEPPATQLSQMLVAWRETGEAIFHQECWINAIRFAHGKEGGTMVLCSTEASMIKEANKTAEFFYGTEFIEQEGARIAEMIKNAKHAIAFTGAGISTAAGIGDFRGKAGQWTEKDRVEEHGPMKHKKTRIFSYEELRPTYTHEALCKLIEMGHLKYVISQNTDGLHRLSGIPPDRISELHGNVTHERCEECDARYERNHTVFTFGAVVAPKPCMGCGISHRTGRKCERPDCRGYLMDTVINFGDGLENDVLQRAISESSQNDLMLSLGSSMMVSPACNLVEMGKPVRLVMCNRQPTPFDSLCMEKLPGSSEQAGSRVYGDCDDLMREVMKHILPAGELQEWEGGREQRMQKYDEQRPE